mgnify:CR=1 FL=1
MVKKINAMKIIRFLIFGILTLAMMPIYNAVANSGVFSAEYKKLTIDTVINPDGSADIKEEIVFKPKKDKHGIIVGLPFSDKQDINIELNKAQCQGKSVKVGYQESNKKVKIYNEMKKGKEYTFNVEYHVPEMLLVAGNLEDGEARYYHQMFPEGEDVAIKNFTSKITFPDNNIIEYFVHGDKSKNKVEGNTLTVHIPLIKKYHGLEIDVITSLQGYNQELINNAQTYNLTTSKEDIDKDVARKKALKTGDKIHNIKVNSFTLLIALCAFYACVYVFRKQDPLIKATGPGVVTQPPSDTNPVLVDMIDGLELDKIDWNLLLLSLELKGAIKVNRDENNELINISKTQDCLELDVIEKNFLNELIGNSKSLSAKKLAKKLADDKIKLSSTRKIIEIQANKIVTGVGPSALKIFLIVVGCIVGLLLYTGTIAIFPSFLVGFFAYIFAEVIVVLIYLAFARDIKQPELYLRWEAYKNYLENYTFIEDKTIDSLASWKQILIYAVALNVNSKVLQALSDYGKVYDNTQIDLAVDLLYQSYAQARYVYADNPLEEFINNGRGSSSANGPFSYGGGFSSTGGSSSGGGGGFSGGGVSSF